jgi:hypothetical protein
LVKNNNKVNKTALTIFSVATAVMLVGGLAVVVIPAATTTAYADATTCLSNPILFEACHTVGKNPKSCFNFIGDPPECEDEDDGLSNKDTGKFTGNARRNCAHAEALECSVEGGPSER